MMTNQQLQALIDSFDGTPADLQRIAVNPVSNAGQLSRLFEVITTEAQAFALAEANPRWAAELAEGQAAYDEMVGFSARCDAIEAADDSALRASLIAALSPADRNAFVWSTLTFPPGIIVDEAASAYWQMVVTDDSGN
jgi:hypothetical protein